MTGRTRAAYDHSAEYYDTDDNPQTLLEHQPVVKAVAPRPHDRLLEAACGTGAYIGDWLDREADVSGLDFSAGRVVFSVTHPDMAWDGFAKITAAR
ncbi:MAG TPA: hypothetical protein VGM53_08140 [Streptosporangiaceae bacterium]